ncbi:ribonuclease P protein component [Tepidicaulis sp. LMO-SS28]|uniref:ribonuclease P protein component n=1 Tax=Tepidicaulis sp. LMO-SS28 TaxID=3447455 RepID=UPI003EE03F86
MDRLTKRREFLAAARGRKWAAPGLVLQARARAPSGKAAAENGPPEESRAWRVGFTVTKKVGNAVIRNRAKRRLRAAARDVLPLAAKSGFDYVLIGRQGTLTRPYSALLEDLHLALSRVHGAKRGAPREGRPGRENGGGENSKSYGPQPKE